MKQIDPLKNIVYISLPEKMNSYDLLPIDPAVLLPIEIDPDNGLADISNLSWEMIIAAILKIFAYNPHHENIDYLRELTFAVRPDIVEEMTTAAIAKAGEKEFDIAEEVFRALINLTHGEMTSLLNLSLLYEERADSYAAVGKNDLVEEYNEKAFDTYKKLLEAAPESADAHFNFGMFYLKRNNFVKAYEHLDFFVKNSGDTKKKKKVKEVLEQLDSKKDTDDLFYSAYDAIRMGRENEAIEKILRFLKSEPEVWNAWFLLGWAYRKIEKYSEGAEAFKKALSLGSDQLDLFNELAICLMELDRLEESREYLLTALKAEPENIKILSNLGILSLKADNPEAAENYFRSVLKIAPDDKIAAEYLAKLG
ncbi:MAG: tetratricopeptide repeat protein [Spirochaetales bacterium]|uniref:Tetratricopeptide repeat protein n=1 Tax=Candidatus Thalassospirochaeta sargassi TaxID=3119039 RepID=A0AAJ1IEY7_9SPIO|nr:tetratricopeptide repeat protein [Spirochaetales bacterium]